jgi:hypothetical protein
LAAQSRTIVHHHFSTKNHRSGSVPLPLPLPHRPDSVLGTGKRNLARDYSTRKQKLFTTSHSEGRCGDLGREGSAGMPTARNGVTFVVLPPYLLALKLCST